MTMKSSGEWNVRRNPPRQLSTLRLAIAAIAWAAVWTTFLAPRVLAAAPSPMGSEATEVASGSVKSAAPRVPGGLRILVEHGLGRDHARERVQQLLEYWRTRFHVHSRWSQDQVKVRGVVMGVPVDATLTVTDTSVDGQANDPGFFLRGLADSYIRGKLKKYLHPLYLER